jgi:hypothetical protein
VESGSISSAGAPWMPPRPDVLELCVTIDGVGVVLGKGREEERE